MKIRIPENQIVNKYTAGNEYFLLSTHKEYKGHYYELNNKTFAGKEFDPKAPEIIKKTSSKFNKLLANPATAAYAKLSKVKIKETEIKSIPFVPTVDDLAKPFMTRFFVKKTDNNSPIKEVSQDTFIDVQSDPLYQTARVNFTYALSDEYLASLDKQMPGLGAYLATDEPETSSDESLDFVTSQETYDKYIADTTVEVSSTASVTDTPQIQDIVPVGPIYIGTSRPLLHIGQSFLGGTIFYVDPTGQHGLVAAINGIANNLPYTTVGNFQVNAFYIGIGGGLLNTNAILAFENTSNAAAYCFNYVGSDGFTGWYLPNVEEADLLVSSGLLTGGGDYWTSTEDDIDNAFTFLGSNDKTYLYKVVPIKRF